MITKENISKTLKMYMELAVVRQKDIVNDTGLSKSYISRIVEGKRMPRIDKLESICSAFNISLSTFFLKVLELEKNSTDKETQQCFTESYASLRKIHNNRC